MILMILLLLPDDINSLSLIDLLLPLHYITLHTPLPNLPSLSRHETTSFCGQYPTSKCRGDLSPSLPLPPSLDRPPLAPTSRDVRPEAQARQPRGLMIAIPYHHWCRGLSCLSPSGNGSIAHIATERAAHDTRHTVVPRTAAGSVSLCHATACLATDVLFHWPGKGTGISRLHPSRFVALGSGRGSGTVTTRRTVRGTYSTTTSPSSTAVQALLYTTAKDGIASSVSLSGSITAPPSHVGFHLLSNVPLSQPLSRTQALQTKFSAGSTA